MEYQALYRKYRPKNFDDVYGQTVPITILKNSIINNKISHAYLFYGPRGTGKTSTAKIFARAINCLDNNNGIQCEKCENCINSNNNECVDIIEIDAASNNGVDEIRELKSKINFVPTSLKYKVYIIDEVHMLSTGAFNALLKTLEEPPEYVIFILATTEFAKVPATIVSRCQTLEFKRISMDALVERLKYVSNNEKIKIDDDSLYEIANYSNGGLRDSIGLLEKVSSYSEKIDVDIVRFVIGNITISDRELIVKYILDNDINNLTIKINQYYNEGIDLPKFVNDIIYYLYDNYLEKNNKTKVNISNIILELDRIYSQMIKSNNPKLVLEVSLLNLMEQKSSNNVETRIAEDNKIVEKIKTNTNTTNISINSNNEIVDNNQKKENDKKIDLINIRVGNTLSKADKNIIKEFRDNWKNISNLAFDENYGNLSRFLVSDICPVASSDEYVVLKSQLEGLSEQINNDLNSVEKIIKIIFNKEYKAICISENEWNKYIDLYKKDKNQFIYVEESNNSNMNKSKSLKDKAKELFDD